VRAVDGVGDQPPNLDALRRDTAAAWDLWEASRYVELGGRIPELLDRAKTAARELAGDQRHAADELLADAYNLTSATLHKVDEHELAWIASDRAMAAAERAESMPLVGISAWWLAHIFLRSGRIEEATGLLKTGIDALEPSLSRADPAYLSVWGAMLLTGAVTAAKRNDRADAWAYVREAQHAAGRLGRDANYLATAFGPTNVALRTVAVPVELATPARRCRSPARSTRARWRRACWHAGRCSTSTSPAPTASGTTTPPRSPRSWRPSGSPPRRSTTTWSCASCSASCSSVNAGAPPRGLRPLAQRVGVL
jgi:hypothetical protein